MAVVNIATVRKRALELLLASPRSARYTDAIGQNSEYPVLQEITDAALAIDLNEVCGDIVDIAESGGGAKFMFASANIVSGDLIPDHEGARGPVELTDGITWRNGLLASSDDEMQEVLSHPALYSNIDLFYFIKFRQILTNAAAARIYLPNLTKTAACQSHERWEDVVLWGTAMSMEKDGGNTPFFQKYESLFMQNRPRAKFPGGVVVTDEIPDARERQ